MATVLTLALESLSAVPLASAAVQDPIAPLVQSVTSYRLSAADAGRAVVVQPDAKRLIGLVAGGDFGLYRSFPEGPRDEAFGDDGWVTTDFGGDDGANAVALDSQGGIVAAGFSDGDLAVARYDSHGHPVRTFGTEGQVVRNLGAGNDAAYAVRVQDDGRVVVAGGHGLAMVVLRFRPDGTLDATFGSAGVVTIPSDGPARALAALPDGAFVVAGGGAGGFHVAKVRSDGALEPTFGIGGATRLSTGGAGGATGLGLLPDGRITVVGERGTDVALVRLTPVGVVDPAFGAGGVVVTDLGGDENPWGIAVAPDGAAAVAGDGGPSQGFVISYRPDGSLDTRFRSTGWVVSAGSGWRAITPVPDGGWWTVGTASDDVATQRWSVVGGSNAVDERLDSAHIEQNTVAAAHQPDGRIVALSDTSGMIGLVRYQRNGSVDSSFGTGGRVVSDLASSPMAVVVQSSGRIVVAGRRDRAVVLVAFRADGSLDRAWGTDAGRTVTDTGDPLSYAVAWAQALDRLGDDRLVLFGDDSRGGLVARYTSDGRPDPTFGSGGVAGGAFPDDPTVNPKPIARQPDGKTLLASSYQVKRMNPDGTLESTFGSGGVLTVPSSMFWGWGGRMAMTLLPDGKLLLGDAFWAGDGFGAAIARFLPNGAVDPEWQLVRTRVEDRGGSIVGGDVKDFVVLPDGRFLAVGESFAARYLPTGALDRTFGDRGWVSFQRDNTSWAVLNVVHGSVDAEGELTVIGSGDTWEPRYGVKFVRYPISRSGAPNVDAWGWNPVGELGNGSTADSRVPTGVTGLPNAVDVSAGVYHALALKGDGTVWAWGWNGVGQLGDGTTIDRHTPVRVAGLSDVVEVAAGAYHSLALKRDGSVWAWGWNALGQLGDGTNVDRHSPVRVAGAGLGVTSIAAGGFHSLSLDVDRKIWAWGWNGVGQLGDGTTVERHTPVQAQTPPNARIDQVSAGTYHSLLLYADGFAAAWGWNAYGQLGVGTKTDRRVPTLIAGTHDFVALSGGGVHSLGRKADGTVWAWGSNVVGQLGDGTSIDRVSPVPVLAIGGATDISAGLFHNAASTRTGAVFTWGWNGVGQLGDGTTLDRHQPVGLPFLPPAAAVASGGFHTLAR